MRDVLDYIGRTDESAILLDQKKAFDRVNRSFLLSLLIALALVLFLVDGFRPFMKALLCR